MGFSDWDGTFDHDGAMAQDAPAAKTDAPTAPIDKDKFSYALGMQFGESFKSSRWILIRPRLARRLQMRTTAAS